MLRTKSYLFGFLPSCHISLPNLASIFSKPKNKSLTKHWKITKKHSLKTKDSLTLLFIYPITWKHQYKSDKKPIFKWCSLSSFWSEIYYKLEASRLHLMPCTAIFCLPWWRRIWWDHCSICFKTKKEEKVMVMMSLVKVSWCRGFKSLC